METINYAPVIKDMTWSHSRVKSFEDCPYRFYLRYIRRLRGEELFFSSYGSFIHKLIERHYKEGLTPSQMAEIYLTEFRERVLGNAPNLSVFNNYFTSGLNYLQNFEPLPYRPLEIEWRFKTRLNDIPFVGCIDFLGEKDGELYVIDNKSRNLKPRSKRKKPTQTDLELDNFLTQLYLYAAAVKEIYGKFPKVLGFNCFREQLLIEEPFREDKYNEAVQNLTKKVDEIAEETEFRPDAEYFKCSYLCEMREQCEYYDLCIRK